MQCFFAIFLKANLVCIKIAAEKVDTKFVIKIFVIEKGDISMKIVMVEKNIIII